MVKILLLFEDSAKETDIKEINWDELCNVFRATFGYFGAVKGQLFSPQYNEYVDIMDTDDISAISDHSKCKFIKLPQKADLRAENCAIFCCDVQERFRAAISSFEPLLEIADRLLKASKILSVPLVVTEQYPKGLLKTVNELDIDHASLCLPKTTFTMMVPEVVEFVQSKPAITNVVLFGVEAHVCVQQTALDLMERGVQVYIVVDATSSRYVMDRLFAFKRLESHGAIITTCESVLFQMIRDKDHPHFKTIQKLVIPEPQKQACLHSYL